MTGPVETLRGYIGEWDETLGTSFHSHADAVVALTQVENLVQAARSFEREYQQQRGAVNNEADHMLLSDKQNALLAALAPFNTTSRLRNTTPTRPAPPPIPVEPKKRWT